MHDLVVDSWRFYKANIKSVVTLILPVLIVVETFSTYWIMSHPIDPATATAEQRLDMMLPSMILTALASPFLTGLAILQFTAARMGQTTSVATLYRQALLRWPSMLVTSVVSQIMIVVGFFAFIFPGFFALARLAYAQFLVMLEDRSPLVALSESWSGSEPLMKELIMGYIRIVLLMVIPYLVIVSAIQQHFQGSLLVTIITNTVMHILMLLFVAFRFRCYWRWRYEGK